jgi:hypothetical protein
MKFRKKPVVIEAVQWTGKNYQEIKDFYPTNWTEYQQTDWGNIKSRDITPLTTPGYPRLLVQTAEGMLWADRNDWIIKGIKGEYYPCKPDIFELTYEAIK